MLKLNVACHFRLSDLGSIAGRHHLPRSTQIFHACHMISDMKSVARRHVVLLYDHVCTSQLSSCACSEVTVLVSMSVKNALLNQ